MTFKTVRISEWTAICDECSSDTDEKTVEKLQEQLNTAKKVLTEIEEMINQSIHECDYTCDNHCGLMGTLDRYTVENIKEVVTAIGGDDE